MQLRNYHPLRPVDHKRPLRRHERDFTHVNFLFLRPLLLLELEGDMQRRAESLPFTLRFQGAQFWLADLVMTEIEGGLFVIALDRENLLEDSLQAIILAFGQRHVFLQKVDVRVQLNFDEIWRLNALFDSSEMNALCPV